MTHLTRGQLPASRRTIAISGLMLAVQLGIGGLLSASDARADADRGSLGGVVGSMRDHSVPGLDGRSHRSRGVDPGVGQSARGSSPSTSSGDSAGLSTGTSSSASASVTAGSDASVKVRSGSTTRTIDRGDVSISISISRSVAIVNEPGGTVIGRAVDKSVAIAVDNGGQDSVTARSSSTATIKSSGTISGVSMSVGAEGSAEAAIAGGPSASATSGAEASIGL